MNMTLYVFSIPRDEHRRKEWLTACNVFEKFITGRLCSDHFTSSDFLVTPSSTTRPLLKRTAIPSVFFDDGRHENHFAVMKKEWYNCIIEIVLSIT